MYRTHTVMRLSIVASLLALLLLSSAAPVSANHVTVGRNFTFFPTLNDKIRIVLIETPTPPEYITVKVDGSSFGISASAGHISNGRWIAVVPVSDFTSNPNARFDVSMGAYGRLSLVGHGFQNTTDDQFLNQVSMSTTINRPSPSDVNFTMSVSANPAAQEKWMTKRYRLVTATGVTEKEYEMVLAALDNLEEIVFLEVFPFSITDRVTLPCASGTIRVQPRLMFGPRHFLTSPTLIIPCRA